MRSGQQQAHGLFRGLSLRIQRNVVARGAAQAKATPELIREGVRITVECGMNGINLEHITAAPSSHAARAIREGLAAAQAPVPSARTRL